MHGRRGVLRLHHSGSERPDKTQRVVSPGLFLAVDLGLSPAGARAYTSSIAYSGQCLPHKLSPIRLRRIIAFYDAPIA